MTKIKIIEDAMNEMAKANISSVLDNLPFQIILQLPDHPPPHVHIYPNSGGEKELCTILIPKTKPRSIDDIKEHKGKMSDTDKTTLLLWMNQKNKRQPKYYNWEVMNSLWGIASK
jgi:hypothetical protein